MSDRRRFLKGLTSLPLATVLANPGIAAAVSAGLQEVEAKLSDGSTIKAALAVPQGQARGSILLVNEWWGLVIGARTSCQAVASISEVKIG